MENPLFRNLRFIVLLALCLQLLSACASYGTISNQPLTDVEPSARYAINHAVNSSRSNEVTQFKGSEYLNITEQQLLVCVA